VDVDHNLRAKKEGRGEKREKGEKEERRAGGKVMGRARGGKRK